MSVKELNTEQLRKLKADYICDVTNRNAPTYFSEIADADETVSDETVFDYYSNVSFVEEDF